MARHRSGAISFVHLHSSSRYNRSAASLQAACESYNKVSDLNTMTEVEFELREKAVKRANGKEFGFISGDNGNGDNCVQSFKNARFSLVYSEQFENSRVIKRRPNDGGVRDQPYSCIAIYDDLLSGKRLIVSDTHYSSSVEGDIHNDKKTHAVIQWYSSFRNVKRRVNKLARKFKCHARLICGDFNVDFKKLWVRSLMKTLAPMYRLTWKNTNVDGGTHGKRIIDGTLIRGKLRVKGSAELFKDDDSSDHRPYFETLVWT